MKHILAFFLKNKRKGWGQRMYRQMQYNLKNALFHYVYIYMTQILKLCFINMALSEKLIRDFLFKFLIISLKDYSNKELFIMVT